MSEAEFREISVQEGYALWSALYDQEQNGLIFVEERQVERLLLITDFHPVHTIYGWRTAFKRAGMIYYLPTVGYSKDDYLDAIRDGGLTILEVAESLVGEVPEGYLPEEMRRMYAGKPFCLSILARK